MSYPRFQALLEAGMAWRVRDQQMALSASAYPHMKEEDQREMQQALREALDDAAEVVEDNTAALGAIRDRAKLNLLLGT
jgi:hypothetical protein